MDILILNIGWMTENIILALLGVFFGLLMISFKHIALRIVFFILWFLFLPNTIYLLTDLQYFPGQFIKLDLFNRILLIAEYSILPVLGVITFLLGLYPLEKFLSKAKFGDAGKITVFVLVNFLISFAVFLGKIQRVSSWEVFTDLRKVITESQVVLGSPVIMTSVFLFGLLANAIYFSSKRFLNR